MFYENQVSNAIYLCAEYSGIQPNKLGGDRKQKSFGWTKKGFGYCA